MRRGGPRQIETQWLSRIPFAHNLTAKSCNFMLSSHRVTGSPLPQSFFAAVPWRYPPARWCMSMLVPIASRISWLWRKTTEEGHVGYRRSCLRPWSLEVQDSTACQRHRNPKGRRPPGDLADFLHFSQWNRLQACALCRQECLLHPALRYSAP
jgi:hypothetical protein